MSKLNCDKKELLKKANIVLASPKTAENIGLAARVIKNTSFSKLSLVKPNLTFKSFDVAKKARDILEQAKICQTIKEAVSSSEFVFGATRRPRENKCIFNFNDIKHLIAAAIKSKTISIVFGREDFGLSAQELKECDSVFYIPANPDFSSYNLATSVGIVCYEIFNQLNNLYSLGSLELAQRKDYETFFSYLEEKVSEKLKPQKAKTAIVSLKRLFLRTHLTKNEISLLKSLFIGKEGKNIKG